MNKWLMRNATREKLRDPSLGDKVHKATLRTVDKRAHMVETIPEWESLRESARAIRMQALEDHDKLMNQFREALEARGVHVTIAKDGAEAALLIKDLVMEAGGRVTKSKSMTSEEIGLNPVLEKAGAQVTETDLGELIVQLAGQAPSHVTAPAIHLSVEDIARIFREKLGVGLPAWIDNETSVDESVRKAYARELSLTARRVLRSRFLQADVGISGANFLVASSGTVVLLENEGNIQLTTCLPRRHIVLAGIDKLTANDTDLAVLLRLLPVSATAQKQTCYVSLFADAHPDMHVILLDNGRSKLMQDSELKDLLTCIRCGACMNACPVYRNVGGHAYGGAYPGPIGALLMPHLGGQERFSDLPFASTLCGACSEACPVKIPLHEHLLTMRARLTQAGFAKGMSLTLSAANSLLASPSRLALASSFYPLAKHLAFLTPAGHAWTQGRELPQAPPETFRDFWKHEGSQGIDPSLIQIEKTKTQPRNTPLESELPEARNLVLDFAEAIAELGPNGETAFHRFSSAAEALELLRAIMSEYEPESILIEGESSEKKDYRLGITGAALLIAESGGIVLNHAKREDGRASTLVDTHVVVASPILLIASIAGFHEERKRRRAEGTWRGHQVVVTGPSRTADVEKVLVIPAHGPARLIVVLCDESVEFKDLRSAAD